MAATWEFISKTILTGNQTTVTLTSIPQTYTDLVLIAQGRSDIAGQGDGWQVVINGTAATSTSLRGFGYASTSAQSTNSDTGANVLLTSGNAWTANYYGAAYLHFPNYTSSSQKVCLVQTFWGGNNVASTRGLLVGLNSLHVGTSAINSIGFATPDSGGTNMMAGSSFYLYGIKNS